VTRASASPWRPTDATVAEALQRRTQRTERDARYAPAPGEHWAPPTGDTQRFVLVGRRELTCLGCGETYAAVSPIDGVTKEHCWRCGSRECVPTASYLRGEEYMLV
jgi:hypothetical protein